MLPRNNPALCAEKAHVAMPIVEQAEASTIVNLRPILSDNTPVGISASEEVIHVTEKTAMASVYEPVIWAK